MRSDKLADAGDVVRPMMKAKILILMAVFCLAETSTAAAGETYFSFTVESRTELESLSRIISIDNVSGDTIRAYANDKQLEAFGQLGYDIKILPHPGSLIEAPMSSTVKDAEAWDSYPTYPAYRDMMFQFAADYPSLCEVDSVGYTTNGRAILFARISDNVSVEENEPEVMFTSSMHGDELTGYVLMLRLIDYLLTNHGLLTEVDTLVNNLEIWINPLANPDGTYRLSDTTVNDAYRYNANWIDLNRNFPDPDEGPHPDGNAWQPETIAMMNFADAHNIVLSANFHGGAEVVNYPWDTWPRRHADDAWLQDLSRDYADLAQANSPPGYMTDLNNGITNGWDWYTIAGGRQDYMTYYHGCREVTIEISSTKLLSASLLPAWWGYNRDAFLDYLSKALYGVQGTVTENGSGIPLLAHIGVLNHDEDSSGQYTDPSFGNYCRMLAPGTYDFAFSADGYYPDTVTGVTVTDGTRTTLDVELTPLPACICDYQADADADGFVTSLDLGLMIDVLFAGKPDIQDSECPASRYDFDCDGFSTAIDLGKMIDFLFTGGDGPCDPCNP